MSEKPPPLDPQQVQALVGNAHGDLDAVKKLLEVEPALVNAAWDWGAGDWETALGAAAHMGRVDIATYLLETGARIDLFAAAMLGKTAVVRAILDEFPEMRDARGPHGILLSEHAKAGGAQAADVLELIEAGTIAAR